MLDLIPPKLTSRQCSSTSAVLSFLSQECQLHSLGRQGPAPGDQPHLLFLSHPFQSTSKCCGRSLSNRSRSECFLHICSCHNESQTLSTLSQSLTGPPASTSASQLSIINTPARVIHLKHVPLLLKIPHWLLISFRVHAKVLKVIF